MLYAFVLYAALSGSPVTACHNAIAGSVNAQLSTASIDDLGNVRSIIIDCVGQHYEQLTKMDMVGAFYAIASIDGELAKRMQHESEEVKAAIIKARKECTGK